MMWRYYQHRTTLCLVRVHKNDTGKAMVYERWGWHEVKVWATL